MATKLPRVHTVLEASLFRAVSKLARRDGVSLSQKVRDLVAGSLEVLEDSELDAFATRRRRTFQPSKALSVSDVRRRLKL